MQTKQITSSNIMQCPIKSMSAKHYRDDGSCQCVAQRVTRRWKTRRIEGAWSCLNRSKGIDCSTTAPRFTGTGFFIIEATGTSRQINLLDTRLSKLGAVPTKEGFWDGVNHRPAL